MPSEQEVQVPEKSKKYNSSFGGKNPLLVGGFELRYLTRKRSDTRADCRVPTQTQTTDIESWCLVYGTTPMTQNRQSADARKYRKKQKNKKKTLSQYKFFLSLVSGLQKQTKWFLSWTGRAVIWFLLIRCLLNFHYRNYQSANRQKIVVEGMAKMKAKNAKATKQTIFVCFRLSNSSL